MARTDMNRALEMALALPGSDRARAVQNIAMNAANVRGANLGAIADRLATITDAATRDANLSVLVQSWSNREPERALDWLMANTQQAPAAAYQGVARELGQNNPAAAVQHLARLPAEVRATWVQSAAQGYAQKDPRAAVDWIEQFRGQAGYANAVTAVAQNLAGVDAPAAAQLLDSIAAQPENAPLLQGVASNVATRWARSQPLAAAQWAAELPSGPARTNAVASTVNTWANDDYTAARSWTMRLAAGAERDGALRTLLARSANNVLDSALIAAFSGEPARQQAVLAALRPVAERDAGEARALIDRYLDAPAQRAQAEQILEQIRLGMPGGRTLPPGMIPVF
jgi:hypothetical protein